MNAPARARVVVVGLGPGDPDLVTAETLRLIETVRPRLLRTARHPSASLVLGAEGGATAMDRHYDGAESFEEVYQRVVDEVVDTAREHGEVLYAVPGSPLVLERTVEILRSRRDVDVDVRTAVSFLDAAWRALSLDPVEAGVTLVDGHDFARSAAGVTGALLVAHVHANWVLSEVKLALDTPDADGTPVVLLHHLGLPDERVIRTVWSEIDRTLEADHLTSLFVPALGAPVADEMVRLHALARRLRRECPWDLEQTHASLTRYLLEEAYEVVDAIGRLDPADETTDVDFIDELGDLLYQVQFHAAIAEEQGRFTIADVAAAIREKLVRRHPHVFGEVEAGESADVEANWEAIKRAEKPERTGTFDGVIEAAPSLALAAKVQKRAARLGLDWPDASGVVAKLREELGELEAAGDDVTMRRDELGDLLFTVVNLARRLDIDPETALRSAVDTFRRRVVEVERLAGLDGVEPASLDPADLDRLWTAAKENLRNSGGGTGGQ